MCLFTKDSSVTVILSLNLFLSPFKRWTKASHAVVCTVVAKLLPRLPCVEDIRKGTNAVIAVEGDVTLQRSLKPWMVLRLYGLEGLQSHIRNHITRAAYFEELVVQDTRFKVIAPRTFSLVCFRLLPPPNSEDNGNKLNHDLLDSVNSTGSVFITHMALSGEYILRFAAGAPLTEVRHVNSAWQILQDKATVVLESL